VDAKIEPLVADERSRAKKHPEKPDGTEFEGRKPTVYLTGGIRRKISSGIWRIRG
jgi:hypothetical protein